MNDVVLTCLCVAKLFSPQVVRYAAQSTGIGCYTLGITLFIGRGWEAGE